MKVDTILDDYKMPEVGYIPSVYLFNYLSLLSVLLKASHTQAFQGASSPGAHGQADLI